MRIMEKLKKRLMAKLKHKKIIGFLLLLVLMGTGFGGKVYMDKQKLEKEYQQGIELIQSYVTDYLVKNYAGIKKIEWQGIGVEYRNSPILGPSLFGNYVDTDVKVYVSDDNYFTMTYKLTDETDFSAVERNLSNTTKIKDQCKMKITPVVSNLSASTRALKVAVKGRFGQKLTYVFKKESALLSDF